MKKNLIAMLIATFALPAIADQAPSLGSLVQKKAVEEHAKHYPGVLGQLEQRGINITKEFDVSGKIKGYVINQGGTSSLVYAVGDYVISGIVFDPSGRNISADLENKYIPKPDISKAVEELEKRASFVEEGAGDRVIYVFSDPNCPHCSDYYKGTRQLVQDGKVKIKWIPVGFLRADSKDKAAYILESKDPAMAMQKLELGYAPDKATNKGLRKVAINQELMQKAGVRGTPGIIYKKDGKWVLADKGLPPKKILSTIDK